jgi:hypothetical protein
VRQFIDGLPPGAVVADVGCGNGKYFGVRKDIAVLGSDVSRGEAYGMQQANATAWCMEWMVQNHLMVHICWTCHHMMSMHHPRLLPKCY